MRAFSLLILMVLILGGCTPRHHLQKVSILQQDIKSVHTSKQPQRSIQGEMESNTSDGIYLLDDDKIYIKTNGKSILSIIDELAFKLRFNYQICTPLPKKRLAIYDPKYTNVPWQERKGMLFNTPGELFDFLESLLNYTGKEQNLSGYKISLNDDGIEISSDIQNSTCYKKVFLYNLTTNQAKEKIEEFFFKNSSVHYSLIPLPAQNSLIIKTKKDILDQIGEIIYSIDSDSPQVLIEAEVFEYDNTIGRKIGSALEYSKENGNFINAVKLFFDEGVSDALPQIVNTLSDEEKKLKLLSTLAIQDKNGGVKILAEPRLVLKPGKEATLRLNTEKYVIVTSYNDATLKKIQTGIIFTITPTILSKSTIMLKLHLEQSEFIPSNEDKIVQSTNKNVIDTSVVVNDGELISIGGIYLTKSSRFESGFPIIHKTPIIGNLFGSKSYDSRRTMIEFMIKPTIKELYSKLRKYKHSIYKKFYE